jgi:hypothetical protein
VHVNLSTETQQCLAFSKLLFTAIDLPGAQEFSNEHSKKGRTASISTVKSVQDAFREFGFASDDKINRRDQILMYNEVMATLKNSLAELIANNMYDAATELRNRIPVLRTSFMKMQSDQEQLRQVHERQSLQKAQAITKHSRTAFWGAKTGNLGQKQKMVAEDLEIKHALQKKQLEDDIACTPEPTINYSTRLLAMRSAEKSLAVGGRFAEAKQVMKRADKLEEKEVEAFRMKLAAVKRRRRNDLVKVQERDLAKHSRLVKRADWALKRAAEHDKRVVGQTLRNSEHDMIHMHRLDAQKKPDFCLKPVRPERKGAGSTASTYKGSLMLTKVSPGQTAVAGLTALHDFNKGMLSGTTTFATVMAPVPAPARLKALPTMTAASSAKSFAGSTDFAFTNSTTATTAITHTTVEMELSPLRPHPVVEAAAR